MDKYKLCEKILKTKAATYFKAQCKQSRQQLIIKKLHRNTTWEEILKSKSITLMKQSKHKYFGNIKEIVKEDGSFYFIFQSMDENLAKVIQYDIDKKDIFKISRNLIQMIVSLWEQQTIITQLRPSHIFVSNNKNMLKVFHFQTVHQNDLARLDLTQLQDLKYLSPEEVLTSKTVDERSAVFCLGLIISEIIIGQPILKAKTKMEYIYQLCQLFPKQRLDRMNGSEHQFKQIQQAETFQQKIKKQNISNQFVALLGQMLKLDQSQRIKIDQLLQAFDLIVQNQQQFQKDKNAKNLQEKVQHKPNSNQVLLYSQIENVDIDFSFESKPTLSSVPNIFSMKPTSSTLASQKNVQDDAVQPIIIKQSSKNHENLNKKSSNNLLDINIKEMKNSRSTKQTLSTIRRPQLTNYALNQINLGVKVGMSPSLFTQNDNEI